MEYGENMVNADAMRMTGVCIFAVAVVQVNSAESDTPCPLVYFDPLSLPQSNR